MLPVWAGILHWEKQYDSLKQGQQRWASLLHVGPSGEPHTLEAPEHGSSSARGPGRAVGPSASSTDNLVWSGALGLPEGNRTDTTEAPLSLTVKFQELLKAAPDPCCLHGPKCLYFLCTSDCHTEAGIQVTWEECSRSGWALQQSVVGPGDLCSQLPTQGL